MRTIPSGTFFAAVAFFLPGTLWCQDLPLFQDVPATSPYYHHANLLAERMITLGCSAEPALYCGEYPSVLTRGQAAVLVIRSIYSARTGDGENFDYPSTPYFADVSAEHGQFKYIQKMKELGITSGCAVGTTYCPEDSTNFGQIAVFTYRARQIRYGQAITPPAACSWDPFWDVPASHPFCPYIRDVYYNYLGFSAISPSCYTGFCPDMTMPRGIMAIYLTTGVMAATQPQYLANSAGQLPPVVVNGANPCPPQIDLYTNNRIDPIGSQWFAVADTFVALRGSPTPIQNAGLWTYTTSESFTTGGGQQLFFGTLSSKSASQVTVTSPPFALSASQDNLNSATHQYYSACLPNGRARYFTSNAPQIFSVNPVVLFRGTSQAIQFRGSMLAQTLRAVSPNTSITTHSLSNQTYQTAITLSTPATAPVGVIGLGLVSTAWDGVHEVSTATLDVTVADPTPVLNPLSQSSGAQGTNLSLTLTGANFGANPTVCILVNGNCLTSTGGVTITRGYCGYTCGTQIPVTISIGSSAMPGTLSISVVSTGAVGMGFAPAPNGGSHAQSNVQPFLVQPGGPIIDSIDVDTIAIGATERVVTIRGSGFGQSPTLAEIPQGWAVVYQQGSTDSVVAVGVRIDESARIGPTVVRIKAAGYPSPSNPGSINVTADVEIKLEQEGQTVISTDGNYSEDTTIRATAVLASSGEALTQFTGTVNIEEVLMVPGSELRYAQNGGTLPSSVEIVTGGTVTFVAKSLAGPDVPGFNGQAPRAALIRASNYPIRGGSALSVAQWVISPVKLHDKAGNGVYDWMQARIRDAFASATGDVAGVLAAVRSYSVTSDDLSGRTDWQRAPTSPIAINPFYTFHRIDGPSGSRCGTPGISNSLWDTLLHEARHAYQAALASIPGNDSDGDFLPNAVPIPPLVILPDTTGSRWVCDQAADTLQMKAYKGDSLFDAAFAPDFASYAWELDAWVFAATHPKQ